MGGALASNGEISDANLRHKVGSDGPKAALGGSLRVLGGLGVASAKQHLRDDTLKRFSSSYVFFFFRPCNLGTPQLLMYACTVAGGIPLID